MRCSLLNYLGLVTHVQSDAAVCASGNAVAGRRSETTSHGNCIFRFIFTQDPDT